MEAPPAESERVDDDPVPPDPDPDADAPLVRDLRTCSASGDTRGMAADAALPGAVGAAESGGGVSVGMGVSVTGSECVVAVGAAAMVVVAPVVLVTVLGDV